MSLAKGFLILTAVAVVNGFIILFIEEVLHWDSGAYRLMSGFLMGAWFATNVDIRS